MSVEDIDTFAVDTSAVSMVDTIADSRAVVSTDEEERTEKLCLMSKHNTLRKANGTYRSILLKGKGFVGLDGPAAAAVCADAETLAIPFFMAPTAAFPAAVALVLKVFAVAFRLERVLDGAGVGLAGAGVDAAEHVWSPGKRCAGQNCCLQLY